MKRFLLFSLLVVLAGCNPVKYNKSFPTEQNVNYPPIDEEMTARVGDRMTESGTIYEEQVLFVKEGAKVRGYEVPRNKYPQVGFDDKQEFFSADGVIPGFLADGVEVLSVAKYPGSAICIVTVFNDRHCVRTDYEIQSRAAPVEGSFERALIYNGRMGDTIRVGYREFRNGTDRPAASNEVEYDLDESRRIHYKGAEIEVVDADSSNITYRVLRNFSDQ